MTDRHEPPEELALYFCPRCGDMLDFHDSDCDRCKFTPTVEERIAVRYVRDRRLVEPHTLETSDEDARRRATRSLRRQLRDSTERQHDDADPDFLNEPIAESTAASPAFPALIEAARRERRLRAAALKVVLDGSANVEADRMLREALGLGPDEDLGPNDMATILMSLPGFEERFARGMADAEAGRTVPLDQFGDAEAALHRAERLVDRWLENRARFTSVPGSDVRWELINFVMWLS